MRTSTHIDNDVFTLTVLPQRPMLVGRARLLTGNSADAQDLVQETLERAWRTFRGFRPGSAVAAWLLTIMKNAWIDRWRRLHRSIEVMATEQREVAQPEPEPPGLFELADVILERLPQAMARLPREFRDVLELRLVSKLSYRAIAKRLRIPAPTVGTRFFRARRKLAALLEADLPRLSGETGMRDLPPGVAETARLWHRPSV